MLDDDDEPGSSPRSSYATSHLCTPPPSPGNDVLLDRIRNEGALEGFVFPTSPTQPSAPVASGVSLWWADTPPPQKPHSRREPVLLPTDALSPPDTGTSVRPATANSVPTSLSLSGESARFRHRSPPAAVAGSPTPEGASSPKYLRRSDSRSSRESQESLVANPPTYLSHYTATTTTRDDDASSGRGSRSAQRFPKVDDGESTATEGDEVEDCLIAFHASESAAERRRLFGATAASTACSFSNRSGSPPGPSLAATKRPEHWAGPSSPLVPTIPRRHRAATQDAGVLNQFGFAQRTESADDVLSHTLPVGRVGEDNPAPVRSISSLFLSGFPSQRAPQTAFEASVHSPRSMSASIDVEASIIPVSRLPDQGM